MPATIGKSDLVKAVATRVGLPNTKVEAVVDALLDQITKELGAGRKVRLTGYFSVFTKVMKPRTVRHPKTGDKVDVPARTKVQFTTGSRMKRLLEARLPSEHFFGHGETTRRAAPKTESGDIGEALDKLGGDATE
jgi:nucleoid DNA-binding protein